MPALHVRLREVEGELAEERKRTNYHWHKIAQHQGERAEQAEQRVARLEETNSELRWMLAHSIDLFVTPTDYRPESCPICAKIHDYSIDLADGIPPQLVKMPAPPPPAAILHRPGEPDADITEAVQGLTDRVKELEAALRGLYECNVWYGRIDDGDKARLHVAKAALAPPAPRGQE